MKNLKSKIKRSISFILYFFGFYKRQLNGKAIVLVFHRVDDSLADKKLTCSSYMFKEICQFAKQYFNVISLPDLINKLNNNQDVSNNLVITFDDGYLDNYEVAAPILKQLNLPATFFIATDFIESNRVTWWDKEDDIVSKWMSWDQVRELKKMGFDIAAHTKNHIDLGVIIGEEAVEEIKGSKDRLEQELSETINLFCYPYGRKEQMTEENRQIVRELGFICCPSAYGGLVDTGSDPFYMQRFPVDNYYQSSLEFGLELLRQ